MSPSGSSARAVVSIVSPTVVLFSVTMAGGALLTFSPAGPAPHRGAGVVDSRRHSSLPRRLAGSVADRFGGQRFLAPILTCAAGPLGDRALEGRGSQTREVLRQRVHPC